MRDIKIYEARSQGRLVAKVFIVEITEEGKLADFQGSIFTLRETGKENHIQTFLLMQRLGTIKSQIFYFLRENGIDSDDLVEI